MQALEHGEQLMQCTPQDYLFGFYEYFYKSRTTNFYNQLERLLNTSSIKTPQKEESPLKILRELFKDYKRVTEKTIENWENRKTIPKREHILELAIYLKIGIEATNELLQLGGHLPLHSRDIIWDNKIGRYAAYDICYYVCLHYRQPLEIVREMMECLTFTEDEFENAHLPAPKEGSSYTTHYIAAFITRKDKFALEETIREVKGMLGHFQQARGHVNKVILKALGRDENTDIDDEALKAIRKRLKAFFVFEIKFRSDIKDFEYTIEYCAYQTTIKFLQQKDYDEQEKIRKPRIDQKIKPLMETAIQNESIRNKGYPEDIRELLLLILVSCYYPDLEPDIDDEDYNPFAEFCDYLDGKLRECDFVEMNYEEPFDNFILKLAYDASENYNKTKRKNIKYLENHLKYEFDKLIKPFQELQLYPLKFKRGNNDAAKEYEMYKSAEPLNEIMKRKIDFVDNMNKNTSLKSFLQNFLR